jgi:hypothetical protein
VAMHMKVADPAVAAIIERTLAKSKLYAFLTQNEADYTFVKHELRDRLGKCFRFFVFITYALLDEFMCFT